MKTAQKVSNSETFQFHYYGYPVWSGQPHGKVGMCPVEIKEEDGRLTVIVTEPETSETTSVMNRFEHIATKLYCDSLLNEDPCAIRWMYHDTKDLAGEESICEVVMEWNGERYAKPKWSCRRVIADGQAGTRS